MTGVQTCALPICLVDFLSGVAYANNGQIKRVANSTFIITPYNVDIMGDLQGLFSGPHKKALYHNKTEQTACKGQPGKTAVFFSMPTNGKRADTAAGHGTDKHI